MTFQSFCLTLSIHTAISVNTYLIIWQFHFIEKMSIVFFQSKPSPFWLVLNSVCLIFCMFRVLQEPEIGGRIKVVQFNLECLSSKVGAQHLFIGPGSDQSTLSPPLVIHWLTLLLLLLMLLLLLLRNVLTANWKLTFGHVLEAYFLFWAQGLVRISKFKFR